MLHEGRLPFQRGCSDVGQDEQVFGEMVNGSRFLLTQIDLRREMACVTDAGDVFVVRVMPCNALSDKGARDNASNLLLATPPHGAYR